VRTALAKYEEESYTESIWVDVFVIPCQLHNSGVKIQPSILVMNIELGMNMELFSVY